jgi:7-cyano-7-deazaguanine reductase
MSDTKNLKSLGAKKTKYYDKPDIKILETFRNEHNKDLFVAPFECFEFSSLCPKTGQPDAAVVYINYVPKDKCVESKSLKLYLFAFRNTGQFMEDITNRICNDLVKTLNPWYIEVYAKFNSRGGIFLRPYVRKYHQFVEDYPSINGDENFKKKLNAIVYDYHRMAKTN